MVSRLTTTGQSYQDPPATNGFYTQEQYENDLYKAAETRTAINAGVTARDQENRQISQTGAISDNLFRETTGFGGNYTNPALTESINEGVNGYNQSSDLIGTPFEGAAVVGNNEGLFSGDNFSQSQVVIAGGVAGKAVTLSTGSVFEIFPTYINQLAKATARIKDTELTEKILRDGRSRRDSPRLARDRANQVTINITSDNNNRVLQQAIQAGLQIEDNEQITSDILNDSGHPPIKRYLQEFSYLLFTRDNAKIIMPFFENPRIEEKRGANYSIIPAAGSTTPMIMFNHTEFANIKVSFRLNPLHIAEMMIKEGKGSVDDFIINVPPLISNPLSVNGEANSRYKKKINILNQLIKEYKEKLTSELPDMIKNWQFGGDNENVLYAYRELPSLDQLETNYKRAQALCLCWIYLIRESVFFRVPTNSSQSQGPLNPEAELLSDLRNFFQGNITGNTQVLLKHGPVFYHIPCALLNYEIKEATETTYDVPTHMANVFDISLTLYATPEAWRAAAESVGTNSEGIELMGNDGTPEPQPEISTPPRTEGAEGQLQNQFSGGIR